MESDLYAFRCKECGFIYLEPFDTNDRFTTFPNCNDCGSGSVEMYHGELSEELLLETERYADSLEDDVED